MECANMCDVDKSTVKEWLNALDECDQEMLLDKYSQKTKEVCHDLKPQEYLDTKMDILILKYSKDALLDSYVNGDPVVDHNGCRLDEFLNNEMADQTMQR